MSFLEKKIVDNKAFFDDQPIPEGHFGRYLKKLNRPDKPENKKVSRVKYLKIAAVILILLSSPFILNKFSVNKMMDSFFEGYYVIKLSPELESIFSQYDQMAENKMEEIPQFSTNDEQSQKVEEFARRQLESINANIAALEKEYAKHPGNQTLRDALVTSKKQKLEIVESIVSRLSSSDISNILPETLNN